MGKGAKMKASSKKDYRHENESGGEEEDEIDATIVTVEDTDLVELKKAEHEFDISEAVEKISEKRATIREKGLESFIKFLRSVSPLPFKAAIASHEETLYTLLVRILKRPSSVKEGKLCCELLNLLALVNGANEEDFFTQFESALKQTVQGGALEELREYALFTLTFMSYICSNDANEWVWNFCEQILTDSAEALPYTIGLKATAAECWLLLATNMGEEAVLEHSCECVFEAFFELLEEAATVPGIGTLSGLSGVDIKVIAGRGFAFLWETSANAVPDLDMMRTGAALCHNPHKVDQVCQIIKSISKESSKSISKKDRKEQRFEFREIEDYIWNGEEMRENIVKLQGAEVYLDTFKTTLVVDCLRKVMGSGLTSILKMFPVVREVLSIEHLTADHEEGWRDKRVGKSSAQDKKRTNFRNQERGYREIDTDGGYYGNPDDA